MSDDLKVNQSTTNTTKTEKTEVKTEKTETKPNSVYTPNFGNFGGFNAWQFFPSMGAGMNFDGFVGGAYGSAPTEGKSLIGSELYNNYQSASTVLFGLPVGFGQFSVPGFVNKMMTDFMNFFGTGSYSTNNTETTQTKNEVKTGTTETTQNKNEVKTGTTETTQNKNEVKTGTTETTQNKEEVKTGTTGHNGKKEEVKTGTIATKGNTETKNHTTINENKFNKQASDICKELYTSMKGAGTDEQKLDKNIKKITKENVIEVMKTWNTLYAPSMGNETLMECIDSDLLFEDTKYMTHIKNVMAQRAKDSGLTQKADAFDAKVSAETNSPFCMEYKVETYIHEMYQEIKGRKNPYLNK